MSAGRVPTGLYVHVPFCLRKCRYCSFYSVVDMDSDSAMRFAGALLEEMRIRIPIESRFSTFYAGGGTPILLEPSFWDQILGVVLRSSTMEDDAEMTIEANPAAVSSSDLQYLRRIGFNRLSIGVQSFDDSLLEFLGRVHKGSHAETLISDAQKAGFECIGLDLMYGIPGQTLEGWKDDLRSAADLGVKHVSCYALTVEEGTPYGHSIQIGDSPAPDERLTVELYQAAHEFLTGGGYEHYEVSNYSLGRKWRSRHNTAYWSGRPYLGFGPSAHSFDGVSRRSWNTSSLNDYLARMEAGKLPEAGSEVLNENQKLLERIMLGLRTSDGVDMEQVSGHGALPEAIRNMLSNWVSHGLCALEGERIRPSARGMLMADGMASSLAAVLDL